MFATPPSVRQTLATIAVTPARPVSRLLVAAAVAVILLGIALRVTQLPTRVLYLDEAVTQIRVAGYTVDDLWRALYDGNPRSAATVRAYAQVGPDASPARTVASLAAEDAQHPPLFYLAELAVVRTFGDSLWAWRALPALFGIAAIGTMWLLARELFDPLAALAAAALFAVSPVERIYAEQAREYSLVSLLALLMTLALVRACRNPNRTRWAVYAVSVAVGLYASPFLGYVLIAHAVAVGGLAGNSRERILGGFAVAAVIGLILAAPWLYQIVTHRDEIAAENTWSQEHWPIAKLAIKWLFNIGSSFFDLEYLDVAWAPVLAVVVLVGLWTAAIGLRAATPEARWIVGTLIVVPALLLALPDVVLGEHRSAVTRYGLPVYAGLSLAVARGLTGRPVRALIMLGAGIAACIIGAQHAAWWDNDSDADEPAIAALVNAAPGAQVASPIVPGFAVTFARLFDDDVSVSLRRDLAGAVVDPHRPVFVLRATGLQLAAFSQKTGLRFDAVEYPRTRTAHAMGASLAGGGVDGAETNVDLARAVIGSPGR